MSILANKDTHVVIQGGVAGQNAARQIAHRVVVRVSPAKVGLEKSLTTQTPLVW